MIDSRKAEVSQDTLAMVSALAAAPTSLRRPEPVPQRLWAPRGDGSANRVHAVGERFPDGLSIAFGALAAEERTGLVRRLLALGLRVGVVRPIVTEDLVSRRSGLGAAERSPARIRGPLPSPRSILRYHDQSSRANAWYDIFAVLAQDRAFDAGSLIEVFIGSRRLFDALVGDRGAGFDVTDAWVLMRSDLARGLITRPCPRTESTFLKPVEARGTTSPWPTRRDGALSLRERLIGHLVARDLVLRGRDLDDAHVHAALRERHDGRRRHGRRARG